MKDKDLLSALLKGVDTGSTGAMSSIDQSNKLAQLLKQDELRQQAIAQNQAQAQAQAQAMGLPKGGYSIQASEGGFGVNPENYGQMLAQQQERENRAAERITQRAEQTGLPTAVQQMSNVERETAGEGQGGLFTDPNYKMKSAGMIKNMLPDWLFNLTQDEATKKERQALQALRNIDIKKFAGANQTQAEMARKAIEQGTGWMADPEQAKLGAQMMRDIAQSQAANLKAGFAPQTVKRVEEAGAVFDPSTAGLGTKSNKPMTFEEFQAMKRAKRGRK